MAHLGDKAQLEARFGTIGYRDNLDSR
jgi:hypothetical protein